MNLEKCRKDIFAKRVTVDLFQTMSTTQGQNNPRVSEMKIDHTETRL